MLKMFCVFCFCVVIMLKMLLTAILVLSSATHACLSERFTNRYNYNNVIHIYVLYIISNCK